MNEELLEQLEAWHEEDEYEKIVDAVQEIPVEERDYELVNHLGRALNNLERYGEAVEQFLTVADEGADDPLWQYRIGLAYYYLEQYDKAEQAFERSDELEPGDEDTLEFLEWIRNRDEQDEDEHEGILEAGEQDGESAEGSAEEPRATIASVPVVSSDPVPVSGEFWNDSELALEQYVSEPPSDGLIESVEEQLVFRLPASYIEMMKEHNGGIPYNRFFPVTNEASGETGYVEIEGILGIGREKRHSLCGAEGSWVVIERDRYPEIGVIIAKAPSEAGVVMLDYRSSGNDGEPEVVYVDKAERLITPLAPNFEAFIQGLMLPE
ncbi:SMI1/KNR4 family protein [Paenibacillus silvae]|uniref:SMI1/KNR4 family protein n=1 Tax=Paenibacillus silvae TaxID=1325358 RepID=UPI00200626FE|nr:SMI1/KNR4 family protein [Paenibacillus silvae]MCK6076743.1 SMI1/KNR4 family protein [Paenibacillus silvae]MCK6151170.1 SMI1/KNR4 family protein [Paenibacillus silvae]MCK6269429.1 SMI1/KNR4 family protein [Paenibacillus silvae]